jgi:hypothetical protein
MPPGIEYQESGQFRPEFANPRRRSFAAFACVLLSETPSAGRLVRPESLP